MSANQLDQLSSFRTFIRQAEAGAEIPPVAPEDLQRLHELCLDLTRRYAGKDGVVSVELMGRACSPDANLPAIWLRHTQLRVLVRHGLLAEWQHGNLLDPLVFRVAASLPMRGVGFESDVFLEQLRQGASA